MTDSNESPVTVSVILLDKITQIAALLFLCCCFFYIICDEGAISDADVNAAWEMFGMIRLPSSSHSYALYRHFVFIPALVL